jgi:hypothetical protein
VGREVERRMCEGMNWTICVCGLIWLDGEYFICKFTEGFIVCCKQNWQRVKSASKMIKLNNL